MNASLSYLTPYYLSVDGYHFHAIIFKKVRFNNQMKYLDWFYIYFNEILDKISFISFLNFNSSKEIVLNDVA